MLNYNTENYNINKLIKKDSSILVIGASDADLEHEWKEKNCVFDYLSEIIEFKMLSHKIIEQMDEKKYDYIIMYATLEYVIDRPEFILGLKEKLTDDGKIISSFRNFDHNSFLFDTLNDVVGAQKIEDVNFYSNHFLISSSVNRIFIECGMYHQKSKYVYIIPPHLNVVNSYIKYNLYARELFLLRPNSHVYSWQMLFSKNPDDQENLLLVNNDNYDEVHFEGSGYLALPITYSDSKNSFEYTNGEDKIMFLPTIRTRTISIKIYNQAGEIIYEEIYYKHNIFFIELELPKEVLRFELEYIY